MRVSPVLDVSARWSGPNVETFSDGGLDSIRGSWQYHTLPRCGTSGFRDRFGFAIASFTLMNESATSSVPRSMGLT